MTKGPWKVFWIASPAGTSARIYSEATTPPTDIAHIPKEWNGDGGDAKLIAAAPEMLEALHLIASTQYSLPIATVNEAGVPCCSECGAVGDHGPCCPVPKYESAHAAVRVAIAKAEDREP